MAHSMTTDGDGDGQAGDMSWSPFNVDGKGRSSAAQLRPDTGLINEVKKFEFELSIFGHGVALVNGTGQSLFGKERGSIHSAANADADDHRGARIHAGVQDDFHDGFFNALDAIGGHQHFNARFILRAEALRGDGDAKLVAGDNLSIDDAWGIVLSVDAIEQRLGDDRFTQVPFGIALSNAGVNSLFEVAAAYVQILPYFQKDNGHAGILAIGAVFCAGYFRILNNLVKDDLSYRRKFGLASAGKGAVNVIGQIICRFLAHLRYVRRYDLRL